MGLSRRQFMKELKLACVPRLELGASVAEVARALEINPSVLHRWRRGVRDGRADYADIWALACGKAWIPTIISGWATIRPQSGLKYREARRS